MITFLSVLRSYLAISLLCLLFLNGCAGLNPGTVDDPGQADNAPTEPEIIDEGYEEGAQYPEESF